MSPSFSQKDKQQRGTDFEGELTKACAAIPSWSRKILTGFSGTPFDRLLLTDAGAFALEAKRILHPSLPYSAFTENERVGLSFFENCGVKRNKSYILVNWHNPPHINRVFKIPWSAVSNNVCSGRRGSIKITEYQELPRINGVWDLSSFLKEL